jgi:hypothetical protein
VQLVEKMISLFKLAKTVTQARMASSRLGKVLPVCGIHYLLNVATGETLSKIDQIVWLVANLRRMILAKLWGKAFPVLEEVKAMFWVVTFCCQERFGGNNRSINRLQIKSRGFYDHTFDQSDGKLDYSQYLKGISRMGSIRKMSAPIRADVEATHPLREHVTPYIHGHHNRYHMAPA